MKKYKQSIGIFDSGFGGLDIMKGIIKELGEYDFVYLGDTARVPYGSRSKEIVYEFTRQAVDFLFKNDCELVILACNTASSDALRKIQREYLPKYHPGKKVLGVIIPTVEYATEKTKNKRIGLIATEGTVKSGTFAREIKKKDRKIKVFQNACPLLVPIIESDEQNSKICELALKKYLRPLLDKNIDTLVLGCTHYAILENRIKKIVGKKVRVISESKIVGKKLKDYLQEHPEIENKLSKKSKHVFYTTDLTDKFIKLGSKFVGKKIIPQKAIL